MKRAMLAAALAAFALAPIARADEIDDALEMFAADDGISAEEKIPAIKAYIEENIENPRVSELVELLRGLANEAGDDEAKEWVATLSAGNEELEDTLFDGDDEEENPTPDVRTEEEKLLLYTIEDAQAAADAAATEALKTGTKPWMPPEEALKEADEAFRRLGPIPALPKETKARVTLPAECVADDFLNNGTVLGAIVNLREKMSLAIGSFTEEGEKQFNEQFDKAMEFPAENVIAWCTNALPIVSEMAKLRVALVNEAISFDETLDEMNMARKVENYEAAHSMLCSLSRTAAAMKAIEARMKELMPKFEALGEMPDPVEERKKVAREYEEAKETIQEYFTFGDEVEDKSIEGEWVYDGKHVEYTWTEPKEGEAPEAGKFKIEKREHGGLFGADLLDQPTLYIVPITEFSGQNLAYMYIYGSGCTSHNEWFAKHKDRPWDKRYDKTDCEDMWMEPCKGGGYATFCVETNKQGRIDRVTRYHLKACKDDDGKDALLVMSHMVRLELDENGKNRSSPYHHLETAVYRPTDKVSAAGAATMPLPVSDPSAKGMASGTTVQEKQAAAAKSVKDALAKYNENANAYEDLSKNASLREAPPPYHIYYVLSGIKQVNETSLRSFDYLTGNVASQGIRDNEPALAVYIDEMERIDGGGKSQFVVPTKGTYTIENNPTKDDENEVPVDINGKPLYFGSGGHNWNDIRKGMQRNPAQEGFKITDHSNTNALSQTIDYKVLFSTKRGALRKLDSASGRFLLEWAHPTTVLKGWENDKCKLTVWPKITYTPCKMQKKFNDDTVRLETFFGDYWLRTQRVDLGFISGNSGEVVEMGKTNISFTAKSNFRQELAIDFGTPTPNTKSVYLAMTPYLDNKIGQRRGFEYVYQLMVMDARKARELANSLDGKLMDEARQSWKEAGDEEIAKEDERNKAEEEESDEIYAFHDENIRFIDENISRLQRRLADAKTPEERRSLQVAIAGQEASKIYEQDRIRARETGEFHASRTPWDDLTAAKFREDIVREVQEFAEAEHARKFVENMASKLNARNEAGVWSRLEDLMEEDPLNAEKMKALSRQVKDLRMEELENAPGRAEAFDRANRLDWIVTGLEYTKAGCEFVVSIGCGGATWSAAKVLGCAYMATTGYIEGGVTNAFKKTVTFAYDAVAVASDFIDGCVEGGFTNGLARGEISFALHYGVPFVLDKMKGPPDGTGCWNSFDLEKLRKWNPKVATRKPLVADVNAEFFEKKFSKKLIEGWKEKAKKLDALKAKKGVDSVTLWKAKKEYYNAMGKVNECPMAKAQLKYNKQYLSDGTSKEFAQRCGKWQEAVKKKALINLQLKKGYNKQKFLDFRNEASMNSVGMDLDIGLDETPNVKVMRGGKEVMEFQITRNGQRVTKYQYCQDAQDEVNRLVKLSTGCDPQKQYVNVTYSGHPEAYKRLELLKNSKNEEYMRQIFSHSSPFEVEQAFDVSRFKADEMMHVKGQPKIMKRYEQYRGWAKDYENLYGPALRGEVKALNAERVRLAKSGRDLPKRDLVRCERLEKTLKKYDKIYKVAKSVGSLETPIYMANIELERVTDKEIPELITDLQTTFKAWNIGEKKNQRALMVVEQKDSGRTVKNALKSMFKQKGDGKPGQPKALPSPEQPQALPAPEKKPVLMLPWFGDKK